MEHHPLADARNRVPVTVRLAPGEDAASLGLLEVAPGIGARWVEPDRMASFLELHHARTPWVTPPLHLLMDQAGSRWTHATAVHAEGKKGKGVVVGVIDTGLDLRHPDLRTPDGKATRVAWMLDLASAPAGLHPEIEKRFGCGTESQGDCAVLSGEDLDKLVTAGQPPTDAVGHGTHVSSIAAGNGGKSKTYVGVAPEATLVVARVTRSSAGESVTDADILNAVRFVFDRAEALGMPAVVNISLGGDYGPHDGTSALEVGLSAFVGPEHPGRALVIAAGNSAGILHDSSDIEYGAHTEARSLPGSKTRVILTTPAKGVAARGNAYVWLTFQQGDDIHLGLELNGEELLGPFGPGEQGAIDAKEGSHPYMAIINGVVGDNSPLTTTTTGAVVAISGNYDSGDRFGITLEGQGLAQIWVQGTGDAEYGSSVGGSLFLDPLKQGTINVPASSPSLLAVGCTLNRLEWPTIIGQELVVSQVGAVVNPAPDSVCYFSAAGPNALGVLKPEISAPGGFVVGAMSEAADPAKNPHSMFVASDARCPDPTRCYVADAQHGVASGTSMSAPQVTGAVALLLEQRPGLSQPELVALLQAGARRFEGLATYDFQAGPGALDVKGSLGLLTATGQPTAPPSATTSWLQVSSGFARPDGSWPVVGTLQLRTPEGQAADGFDAAPLTLETNYATLRAPLHRVAPGLWQFTAAAPLGSGGQKMLLRVRYGAEILAERELPIGADIWSTRGAPESRGGCALAAPPTPGSHPSWIPLMSLAALLVARRRRA
jgi:MYXO-CTERM domain-containing protein